MPVTVTKTTGHTAEIAWDPQTDDPHGFIAYAVETDQLAYAIEALGDTNGASLTDETEARARLAARHTAEFAELMKRRRNVQVVKLHDDFGLSWRVIADILLEDPDKQSSVRRMYDSGRRHIGY